MLILHGNLGIGAQVRGPHTQIAPSSWTSPGPYVKQGQTVHMLQLFGIYIPLARLI